MKVRHGLGQNWLPQVFLLHVRFEVLPAVFLSSTVAFTDTMP
jgi:hypothetical protein